MNVREFTRINYLARASIHYGNTVITGHTSNISYCGLFIETPDDIPLNTPVYVAAYFRSDHDASINLYAEVVRKESNGMGLKIKKLSANSFLKLRDIIVKNCVDHGKIMQESFKMLKCIY